MPINSEGNTWMMYVYVGAVITISIILYLEHRLRFREQPEPAEMEALIPNQHI